MCVFYMDSKWFCFFCFECYLIYQEPSSFHLCAYMSFEEEDVLSKLCLCLRVGLWSCCYTVGSFGI